MMTPALPTSAARALTGPIVALALMALSPAAEAKVPRSFFGAEADPVASMGQAAMPDADFARMRSAKLGALRVAFNWGAMEPTQGAPRNWSFFDATVERAARARTDVLALLVGSPLWAADDSAYAPTTPAARSAFSAFVTDVVRRYGTRGSFWRANPGVPKRPIASYQVWNEPNYPPHWSGDPTSRASEYASLLQLAGRAIRRADKKATITTAGLLASSSRGPPGYVYLNDLYKTPGIKRYFDAVAIHPYAENAAGVQGELVRVRRAMRRNGDRRTGLWITEIGWGTGGGNQYFSIPADQQAARLTESFRFLAKNRKRFGVRRVVWFSWRDRPGRADRGWEYYCGLFTLDGQPKPAWASFRRFTRATR